MILPKITENGSSATTGAASATIAIPNNSAGKPALKVMITVEGLTHVLPGTSAAVATTASTIVSASAPLLIDTVGISHIAHLQLTAAQLIVVTPIE